jgi:hypothetical protein
MFSKPPPASPSVLVDCCFWYVMVCLMRQPQIDTGGVWFFKARLHASLQGMMVWDTISFFEGILGRHLIFLGNTL